MARKLSMAFVMDPIESIQIDADTTFVLMLEAQQRGHRVLYCQPGDLGVDAGAPVGRLQEVRVQRKAGNYADLGPLQTVALDELDVIFQRKDPPVDEAYVVATQILGLCRRARVLNRPAGILTANEKLYALLFPELMPETRVTRSIPELLDFLEKMGGEMIVKPLDGKGGEGIFHITRGDRNLSSILEQATRFGERWTLAQRYLPAVREGDKRILLVDGEPIGALYRVPAPKETRANLHVGGQPKRASIDEVDRQIIARIAPSLREDGLFFVGIDVIGGKLTEVNVTSPTGVQEINTLENRCLEAEILDRVEGLVGGNSG